MRTARLVWCCALAVLLGGCARQPERFTTEVLNPMTPVKDQGDKQTCWIYAMLAAIETEHIGRGDSVNLSPAYVEWMLEEHFPGRQRAMGQTLIRLIQQYGICSYNAYRSSRDHSLEPPRQVFMLGAVYTPQEFARSVCAPDEYVALTSTDEAPYGQLVVPDVPDNWEHNRLLNVPMDTLLCRTERAVRRGHGVCWESRDHAMAIVGLAHDEQGAPYFIMKNSWGADKAHGGLDHLSYADFRRQTLAINMTKEAYGQ